MDEEQGLVSPIASGIRGIRRSVSSSIFGARPAVAQPDPQTTSLLQQNSLALNNLSRNLRTVSVQVSSLNNSLNVIKDNLVLSDTLQRQRENEKIKRERILAEQALREGKESQLERKIQNALLMPVRRIARKAQGLLSRLGNFFMILAGGWLTDKALTFIRLASGDNIDALNEFKDKLIKDLLILGGIGLTFTIGIRRILGLVGRLGAAAFKITFNRILKTPIRAILRYLKNNVLNFKNQVISFFRSLPGGGLLGLLGSALISIPVVGPFLARKLGIGKNIANTVDDIPVPKNRSLVNKILGNDTILKKGVKGGLRDAFNFLVPVDLAIEAIFGIFDFMDRKDRGQNNVQAGVGVGGEIVGGLTGAAIALTIFPEPFSSVAGTLTLLALPFITRMLGGAVADEVTGANKVNNNNVETNSNQNVNENIEANTNASGENSITPVTLDLSENVNPVNVKKELNVAGQISSLDESANIVTIPLNTNMGSGDSGVVANNSGSSANSTPAIPSEDPTNNYIALTESLFNVVAV